MTLQSPDAGGLDENRMKESVLEHLRAERSVPSLSFAEDPVRLMGGFDTLVYAFRLAGAPTDLAGPLVLRVFPGSGGVGQASKEAIFQNAVASSGFPVPRVIVAGGERTIDGRAFNIMERIPGHSLMEDMFADPEAGPRVADQLAQTLADLHAMPSSGVEESLRNAGFPMHQANLSSGLRYIQRYVAESAMAHLAPATEWLTQNQPSERDTLSVCHGDFHPGNVMADGGQITGVLDWPGALLADPEYDVAITLTLIAVAGPALADNVPAEVFEAFANGYLEAYSRRRTVDPERLQYYRAYRAIRAFVRATAARTPGVDPDLMPRDQYPWAEEGAARRLAGVIKDTTGLDVPLPPGVEPA